MTEPVIPALMPDGKEKSIGIKEAFLEAHHIRDISGSNPLERYALLRLLIAFAMDMLHPATSYDRASLLEAGSFSPETLEKYIAECEKDGPRFDLFDEYHPFLQSQHDENLDAKSKKPIATLIHALPSGNNHIFIDHRLADSHRISIPDAFRALCASYIFCVSGTAGPSSVNNTPPLYAVVIGENLFETMVINMLSEAETAPLSYGVGEVAWRKQRKIKPREQVPDISLLEGLTWMPRRITLIAPEDSNYIVSVCCQAGLDFKGNDLWNDPHVPCFRKKDGTFGTVKPELGRSVWRDAGSLLFDHDSRQVRQPPAIRCINNLFEEDELPIWIPIRAAGLVTNQAAYTGWCESELSIPRSFLYDQNKADMFREDIHLIELTQSQIYSGVQRFFDKPRKTSVSGEHETATQCQQHFLNSAHDLLFGDALTDICGGSSEKDHNQRFCESVKRLIRNTLKQILYTAGNDRESMMRQIEAEKWIWFNFNKTVKEREERYAGS